ncbi:cysteine desulfurase NifS [Ammoniphilus oxalaticus]|uniref:cysteine desulfurase n=1 Tax=Ammoniphilus oxalaticus TaxID=66863 RepID=A0A419SLX9_9BACL|nr:cysteine desulfurase family protein [Ammoniphilus oxalaticus]RKD25077.1 cysteine desulfurase NifS [Ammoniphilus oxalaticus]
MDNIYLDYNASTPIDQEVAEAMQPYLSDFFGNPSSSHWASKQAGSAIQQARAQVASLLGCSSDEIIFTSGGSEANNHALKGVFYALQAKGKHIITSKIEHPAILAPCHFLEKLGAEVTYVGVDEFGQVSVEEVKRAIREDTILISIMHANNEVGTLQPIEKISHIAKERGILLHTDAAQSVGKVPTRVDELGVDLLTIAGHKMYAPKGVGALYIRQGTPIESFIHGAGHENGRRAGTENVMFIVGLGKASALAEQNLENQGEGQLRDHFEQALKKHFGERVVINGHPTERLPNTASISFVEQIGQDILKKLPEVAASTGAACDSGQVQLSSVLKEMKVEPRVGMGTIRFSLGRYTTLEQIEHVVESLVNTI